MLFRYLLINHIKTFTLLLVVLIGILYAYMIGEVFLVFKNRNPEVVLSYSLNFLPTAFFYSGAFVNALALLVALRRLFQRKIDLLIQSFGISPLRFFSFAIFFSLFLSIFNLFGSYWLYPQSQKRLFSIEKEYKKAKEIEKGIVRNLWLTQEKNGEKEFYNFELVDLSTGKVHGFYLLKVKDGSITQVATAETGEWHGEFLNFPEASLKDLSTGEEKLQKLTFEFIDLSQIGPLAEKPEHLSMRELFVLSLLGKGIGINYRQYAYELSKRTLTSFLPLFMSLIVGWVYIRWRSLKLGLFALVVSFSAHWFFINLIRSTIENTNLSLPLILLLYAPIPILSLKGLYDLSKGFRV
ncbi:MAG: LptF/LptG family permease [Aquificaceae bacterium]